MTEYKAWCEKIKVLPVDLPGAKLDSANKVKVIILEDGEAVLLKIIRPEVCYVPRIKALGEIAYALFDWYLDTENRVTPNVYATSPTEIWRQFIPGLTGETWRGHLYEREGALEAADLMIIDCILKSQSAQRIALLDFIFLCQDRSANNWLKSNKGFYAIDNVMFWPYKGRFADKLTMETGRVAHLSPPMNALVSTDSKFSFRIGIFSSLYAGRKISDSLLAWLSQIDWPQYLDDLGQLGCKPLGYSQALIADWRFAQIKSRVKWLLRKGCFPNGKGRDNDGWRDLIGKPQKGAEVWQREWEI